MAKRADTLAREYELGNEDYNFYQYIIDSLINGQRQQVRSLFNKMHKDNKKDFLINYLDESVGIEKSVKNICIDELI